MPEINLFNGGLNTFKDARKLEVNECTDIINADVSSGSVSSLPQAIFNQVEVEPTFLEYQHRVVSARGELVDFTKMHQYLFKSNGVGPRFTSGDRDPESDRLIWHEMGIDTPTKQVKVGKLTTDKVQFHYGKYPGTVGAIQNNTAYTYMFEVDGVLVTQTFTSDSSHAGQAIQVDTSALPGILTGCWRKVKGNYYELDAAKTGRVFKDFALDIRTMNYPIDKKTLAVHPFMFRGPIALTADWKGNGTALVGLPGGGNSKVNFYTGAWEPKQLLNPVTYTILTHTGTVDDVRVKGMKMFRCNVFYAYQVWSAYMNVLIRYDGYFIESHSQGTLVNTPRVLMLNPADNNDGIGDDINMASVKERHMKGEFEYAITYASASGEETAIGPISSVISSDGEAIVVDVPGEPDLEEPAFVGIDAEIAYINLYRRNSGIYSGGTSFLLVRKFTVAEVPMTIVDYTKIENLGKLMPSRTVIPTPDDILYFTEHKGRLFGATKGYVIKDENYTPAVGSDYPPAPNAVDDVFIIGKLTEPYTYTEGTLAGQTVENGDRIRYTIKSWILYNKESDIIDVENYFSVMWSNLGKPLEWDGMNFLNVSYNITGMSSCANGLIIYSPSKTYVLTNTETNNFNYRKVSGTQGCVNNNSIQEWQGNVICASAEGLSMTNGGEVKLVSYQKLGLVNLADRIRSSAVVGEDYFLLFDTGVILRYNLTSNIFSYIEAMDFEGIAHMNGKLYGTLHTDMYLIPFKVEAENYLEGKISPRPRRTFSYKSGEISESSLANQKEYDKVRVNMEGDGYITIYIDGKEIIVNAPLTPLVTIIGIPNEKNKGYSITFEVSGVGILHCIEYSVKGRDNG